MNEKTALRGGVRTQSLNGQWMARSSSRGIEIPASVPGDIFYYLLKAKQIPDPFYRDNEKHRLWIGRSNWSFSREFTVSRAIWETRRVLLRRHGLDTLSTIIINGRHVGRTDNMFRSSEFDVEGILKPGTNTITITFAGGDVADE